MKKEKIKDEDKFFKILTVLIEPKYILSKSIKKPVNASHIFLSDNFNNYGFESSILKCYRRILNSLNSNMSFSSKTLAHHLDGLIINHPLLGTRIVEFDEEQHFTPARIDSLLHLSKLLNNNYFTDYINTCNDLNYLRNSVLKKHRIKSNLPDIPDSFKIFVDWLVSSREKCSGYICKKNGFEFLGGRIAQRAYYDCLRDTAHLSIKNSRFNTPIRFSKKEFEDIAQTSFSKISEQKTLEIIQYILRSKYSLSIN